MESNVMRIEDSDVFNNIKNIPIDQLKEFAKTQANTILRQINKVSKDIEEAKKLSKKAEDSSTDLSHKLSFGMFGESATDKRSKLNTETNIMQNKAMDEMNKIIQQTIVLTTASIVFSKYMIEEMAAMMVNGFVDSDGKVKQLNEYSKKQVDFIIKQAKSALDRDIKNDERHEKNEKDIANLQDITINHDEKFKSYEENVSKLQNDIEQLNTLINNKSKNHTIALGCAIFALLLAIVSLLLNFIK